MIATRCCDKRSLMEKISKKKIVDKISFIKRKKADKCLHMYPSINILIANNYADFELSSPIIYYQNKNNVRDLSTVIITK